MDNYKKGNRVRHPKLEEWGIGQVLEDSDGRTVRAFFVGAGAKTLSLAHVRLTMVTGADAAHPLLDSLGDDPGSATAKPSSVRAKPASALQQLLRLRPHCYHTCNLVNFQSIQQHRALLSPDALLADTEYAHLLSHRRKSSTTVTVGGRTVEIRDNRPLALGSLALDGCTLEGFLRLLNRRVYLWPGDEERMISTGRSHFERYRSEGSVRVIRMPLADLLATNPDRELEVTFCNSGSARHHQGRPATRGPATFQPISAVKGPVAKIKELTFLGSAKLPSSAMWSESCEGPWASMTESN